MSLRRSLSALPAEKWKNDTVYFKKIQSEDDLIYATFLLTFTVNPEKSSKLEDAVRYFLNQKQ